MEGPATGHPAGTPTPPNRPGAVKADLAAETLRLYAGDWAGFARFCAASGQAALPAAPDLVAAFLATPGSGRAALARRLAAIDHRYRQHGLPPPGDDPGLRAALRQARQAAPRRSRPPAPSPAALQGLAQSCPNDLAGRRDRALLLLAAAGLGRAALVGLNAEQLRFTERGLEMVVGSPRGEAPVQVARSAALASCPVRALEEWLRVSATRYGPVFRKVNRWGQLEHAALGTDAVRLILARRAAALRPARR
jgi:integrase